MSSSTFIPRSIKLLRRSLQASRGPANAAFPAGSAPCRHVASTASQSTSAQPTSKRGISTWATALAVGVAGYGLALVYPPAFHKFINPPPVEAHPHADSEDGIAYTKAIEDQLQNLDIVKQLREATVDEPLNSTSPNTTSLEQEQVSKPRKYKEMRPYSKVPLEKKRHSLTQSTLRGPGMFAVPPLLFYTPDNKECIAIMHIGQKMCGHNGIVHGGLLATILDEAIARPAFFMVPNRVAMTAYLNVRYKAPTPADTFIVVRVQGDRAEGRKAWASGTISNLDGKVLVEADSLYVEPKNAWALAQTSAVKEALEEAGE
ncbi:Thioesterase/thiol ester dehydrase-isomerase [Cystobasidium minutum MCA 4210]|uniref:Thioesterase/thiol ester dehydrase-isomerase n=1 Tax=Cystobasidium minutum MCA 4210 TaxID=1397322 RepID=UPI0034CDAA7C|eukprot:jgi/Rhomi1/93155/CE93154_723